MIRQLPHRMAWICAALTQHGVLQTVPTARAPSPTSTAGAWPAAQCDYVPGVGSPAGDSHSVLDHETVALLVEQLMQIPCVRFSWLRLLCQDLGLATLGTPFRLTATPLGWAMSSGAFEGVVRDWYVSAVGDNISKELRTYAARILMHVSSSMIPNAATEMLERIAMTTQDLCGIRAEVGEETTICDEDKALLLRWFSNPEIEDLPMEENWSSTCQSRFESELLRRALSRSTGP